MSKRTETAEEAICLSEETVHDIVDILGKALKPQVFYHPDHHQMTEDALKVCQNHVQTTLKKLVDALPPTHWLVQEIVEAMASGERVWDHYPF